MKDESKIVTGGRGPDRHRGAVNPPVYHVSTILHGSIGEVKEAIAAKDRGERVLTYGRYTNPTLFALEDALASLEGGYRAVIHPSGLAAITGTLLSVLKAGDHILLSDSVYGPARAFCNGMLARFGVSTTYYDPLIGAGIEQLIRPETRLIYLESPGSVTFEIQDVPAICAVARRRNILTAIDNTWGTPLFFKPFSHGIDISIHAGTKYIVGHSDAMLGVVTMTEAAWPSLRDGMRELGVSVGPDDLYLALRGLRTLSVRLARHQASGIEIAKWFEGRPEVARVLHPALPSHPGHALWKRDFLGASGLFAVELKPCSPTALAAFVDHLEYFGIGFSWGGYESLVVPQNPEKIRTATKWMPNGPLLRFHIGLEDVDDLKADLAAGFERLRKAG